MAIKLIKEINPVYETLGLIYLSRHFDGSLDETVDSLDSLGISGKDFCRDQMGWLKSYVASFSKKYVPGPDDDFFFEEEPDTFMLFSAVFAEHPEIQSSSDTLTDEEILDILGPLIVAEEKLNPGNLNTAAGRFDFVGSLDADPSFKWKVLSILNEPRRYLKSISDICVRNLPALNYALSQNKKTVESLIAQCPDNVNPAFEKTIKAMSGDATLYVSLAAPLLEWFICSKGFYGILVDKAFHYDDRQAHSKDTLIMLMKALSDKSKFEILSSLKASPKYNLEIAEELGLTPATMSHHMGILLSNHLVSVIKRDGKVYYHMEQETIKEAIELMEQFFL